ncbi:MAG: LysR family transcriptional regulator [Bdellovibrionales bacterium]|nr:LysR family transcriptional regulator [Bdellovibrionales bacterium]
MLTIPDLNRLKVFYVVYANRSIVRAANVLNVTRSAVSQSLKALEKEVHAPLFLRNSKKVQPTPAAETLFKLMEPFLQELESALQNIETGRKHPTGHLRIGAPLDFGSDYLTNVIGKFRQAHPTVSYELILGVPIKQLELLLEGKLDIAFIDNGDVFSKSYPISVETIQREDFVLVSNAKFYAENIKGDHSLSRLQRLPIVDYLPHAPVTRMWFKHHFGKSITDLNVSYSAESVRAVLNAVSLGMGVGVIPSHLIGAEANRLKIISTDKKNLVNQIALALPLAKKLTLTEKTFVSFLKAQK